MNEDDENLDKNSQEEGDSDNSDMQMSESNEGGQANNQNATSGGNSSSRGKDVKKTAQNAKKIAEYAQKVKKAAEVAKVAMAAFTSGPLGWTIIVVVLVVGIAISGLILYKVKKGFGGRAADATYASAAASTADSKITINELKNLYNQQSVVSESPEDFYLSQADDRFNKAELQGTGFNKCEYKGVMGTWLKCAGCALTSMTMALRYYGVDNVTPDVFANKWAEINGGDLKLNYSDKLSQIANYFLSQKGLPEKKAYRVQRAPTVEEIKKYIANGMPMVTQGQPMCGSSSYHFVLIIGITSDGKSLIISDPAGKEWLTKAGVQRGSPARYCNINDAHMKSFMVYQ